MNLSIYTVLTVEIFLYFPIYRFGGHILNFQLAPGQGLSNERPLQETDSRSPRSGRRHYAVSREMLPPFFFRLTSTTTNTFELDHTYNPTTFNLRAITAHAR